MSSTTGYIGINGNLNVSNSLNSSGLSVKSGTVDFTGASFVNSCIPISSISGSVGGSTNASTITVSSDASTISNGFLTYCGVTNNNVVLRTYGSLRFNSTTGTLSTINFIGGTTTQPTTDNSTNLASTEFVKNNISSLSSIYATIASLSSYLTTSNANSTYATIASLSSYLTATNASSTYVSKANPTFTGNLTLPTTYSTSISGQLGYQFYGLISSSPSAITDSGKTADGTKAQYGLPAPANTIREQCIISIPTGVWLIQGGMQFYENANCSMQVGITSSLNAGVYTYDNGVYVSSCYTTSITASAMCTITRVVTNISASPVTYYLTAQSNFALTGTSAAPYCSKAYIYATRIA